MLQQIRMRRLGVIDEAEVTLSPGLTVLTGETGAGKTMVVTALGLVLGSRADTSLVRAGADQADVEAIFDLSPDSPAGVLADELGADTSDGLIIARTIQAGGRSRAWAGGRPVPTGVLADLGERLVAVHGQADQWRLRTAREHRDLLDLVAGPAAGQAIAAYRQAYDGYRSARRAVEQLRESVEARAMELDALKYGLAQVAEVDPQPGEDVELRAEAERLGHVDALRQAAATAHDALAGGDDPAGSRAPSAAEGIRVAQAALVPVAGLDETLTGLTERVDELGYLAADLAVEIGSYLSGLDADPARLAWVQDRLAALATLTRRYGSTSDEVRQWAEQASRRAAVLDHTDDEVVELEARLTDAAQLLGERAAALTQLRQQTAQRFAVQVGEELAQLAMGSAQVDVEVTGQDDPDGLVVPGRPGRWRFTADGVDDVDIRLTSGGSARSLTKGASGGELSRVMLAIELVAARSGAIAPTMVFDEVDAGVGGRAAVEVGARLARLARHTQVVVVTHLAQVAAYADVHLVVSKSDDGRVVASDVQRVQGQQRRVELARMMSGQVTDAALEHADELLSAAGTG